MMLKDILSLRQPPGLHRAVCFNVCDRAFVCLRLLSDRGRCGSLASGWFSMWKQQDVVKSYSSTGLAPRDLRVLISFLEANCQMYSYKSAPATSARW
jgi:hypothetical protein